MYKYSSTMSRCLFLNLLYLSILYVLQDFGICKFLSFLRSNTNINFSVYQNSHFNGLPQFVCEIKRPEEISGEQYPKIYGTSYGTSTSRLKLDQKYMSYARQSAQNP